MTSKPLVRRTFATLRSAEFGFFGVVVYTRVHTPRFWGDCCSAGTFLRDFCTVRGVAISWLIVGILAFILQFARNRSWLRKFILGYPPHRPPSRENRRAKRNHASHPSLSGKRFDATEDRELRVNRPKPSNRRSRSCIRIRSQEDTLWRTKIVLALPSYNRQRLSGIRRGWCPWRPCCGRTGVPFRLWLCSPPVVEWPPFISRQ